MKTSFTCFVPFVIIFQVNFGCEVIDLAPNFKNPSNLIHLDSMSDCVDYKWHSTGENRGELSYVIGTSGQPLIMTVVELTVAVPGSDIPSSLDICKTRRNTISVVNNLNDLQYCFSGTFKQECQDNQGETWSCEPILQEDSYFSPVYLFENQSWGRVIIEFTFARSLHLRFIQYCQNSKCVDGDLIHCQNVFGSLGPKNVYISGNWSCDGVCNCPYSLNNQSEDENDMCVEINYQSTIDSTENYYGTNSTTTAEPKMNSKAYDVLIGMGIVFSFALLFGVVPSLLVKYYWEKIPLLQNSNCKYFIIVSQFFIVYTGIILIVFIENIYWIDFFIGMGLAASINLVSFATCCHQHRNWCGRSDHDFRGGEQQQDAEISRPDPPPPFPKDPDPDPEPPSYDDAIKLPTTV